MRAARVYAKIAPAAGHALHMPSHIFFASAMWEEAVSSNQAAWKASVERAARKKLGADEHNFHALFWLEYAYLQLGRYGDARKTLALMEQDAQASGSERAWSHRAMMRAAYVVETRRFESPVARALSEDEKEHAALLAEGFAAAAKADTERIEKVLAAIRQEPPPRGQGMMPYAMGRGARSSADPIMKKELEALLVSSRGEKAAAVALAREAAAAEDAMSFEFGPPVMVKPAHELAGELLLAQQKPAEAREEFERSLARAPGRALSILGLARAAAKSGDQTTATEAYRQLAAVWHAADMDLPELSELRNSRVLAVR